MKKKCLAVLTVAATLSVASNSFAALAGPNTVNSAAIIDGQVKTADLAAGAVTDAKISGPISTSKLSVGTGAGTVAAGNHNHEGLYQKKYGNVIVVATSGGDYSDPVVAINSITNATASNPYLVKIMPGVYNTGSNPVQMKSFVDIEGSGENSTKIIGSGSTAVGWFAVSGASDAELRSLTVEYASSFPGSAINNLNVSPKITHVTAISSTGGGTAISNGNSSAIFTDVTVVAQGFADGYGDCGIYNNGGAPAYTNVSVDLPEAVSGSYGIMNFSSSPTFHNLTVTVQSNAGGVTSALGGTPTFDDATINGGWVGFMNGDGTTTRINNSNISAATLVNSYGTGKTLISNTMVTSGSFSGAGYKCVSVYDGNLDIVNCP